MAEVNQSAALVEAPDRWELRLAGHSVTQCRFDYAFTIVLYESGSSFEVRVGEPFQLSQANGDELTLVPEGEPGAMGPALALLRQTVEQVRAFKDGRLEIRFGDGGRLRVPVGEGFEPWELVGPAGLRIVSLPGGELAIWDPDESDASDG